MEQTLSKKIVVLALILAIIVSAYLTLMSLKNRYEVSEEQKVSTVQAAKVSLTVLPPEPIEESKGDISAEEGGVG